MKKNSLILVLFLIIMLLVSYIIYDKYKDNNDSSYESNIEIVDTIELEYVNIYLTSDGLCYIVPINKDKISKLDKGKNLKDRLNTLYDRGFFYDIYVNNEKIKGFKIELDSKINSIKKIEKNGFIYVIFVKDNHTIGLFNYDDYYNLLITNVIDNYNNYKNVYKIGEDKIYFIDGKNEEIKIKESDNL